MTSAIPVQCSTVLRSSHLGASYICYEFVITRTRFIRFPNARKHLIQLDRMPSGFIVVFFNDLSKETIQNYASAVFALLYPVGYKLYPVGIHCICDFSF